MRWGGKGKGREMGGRREGERRRKKEGKGEEEGGKRGEGGQFYISLPVNTTLPYIATCTSYTDASTTHTYHP